MKITREFLSAAYPITEKQFELFQKLHAIFLEENQKINLSAIRDPKEVWIKHFFDSILAAALLQDAQNIIDLGSGGGFPLLPLAILFPEKQFSGVESVGKKAQALEKFSRELDIKNVQILQERAEVVAQQNREKFDALTARAFAHFPVLLEIGLPLLKIGAKIIAFRGPEHEADDFLLIEKLGAKLQEIVKKALPSGEKRELWIVQKTQKTDSKFPRDVGIPKKRPLQTKNF